MVARLGDRMCSQNQIIINNETDCEKLQIIKLDSNNETRYQYSIHTVPYTIEPLLE